MDRPICLIQTCYRKAFLTAEATIYLNNSINLINLSSCGVTTSICARNVLCSKILCSNNILSITSWGLPTTKNPQVPSFPHIVALIRGQLHSLTILVLESDSSAACCDISATYACELRPTLIFVNRMHRCTARLTIQINNGSEGL